MILNHLFFVVCFVRYSAGDEMAYRNMASSRDSATVQSRINSTSVLQSEIVTNKTVAAAEKQAPGKNAVKTPQDTTQQSADKWRVWLADVNNICCRYKHTYMPSLGSVKAKGSNCWALLSCHCDPSSNLVSSCLTDSITLQK